MINVRFKQKTTIHYRNRIWEEKLVALMCRKYKTYYSNISIGVSWKLQIFGYIQTYIQIICSFIHTIFTITFISSL